MGHSGQQEVEGVFRGLKDGDWLGWGPMYHWTDRKIRIHAFYCMLGISLLQHLHKQAQAAWNGISMEQLLEELRQIQPFVLLYPPQGEKGPHCVATVLSKLTLTQQVFGQNPRFGSIAYYPTWVIPFAGRNLLTAQCITALSTSPAVNSQ